MKAEYILAWRLLPKLSIESASELMNHSLSDAVLYKTTG